MEITRLELVDLYTFRFIQVKKLVWTPESRSQIVIGTNGSGKSSLLRQMNPLPPKRSDFGPEGYKKIEITHRGVKYILTTDFRNKTSPHSFIMDDRELNDGGTTGVQEELVATHLGYTKAVHDILFTGNRRITQMVAGARKNYIMQISPYQLDFLLDEHKKVASAIKATKTNLTHLHERKALLEGQFLGQEEIAALEKEKAELSDLYNDCTTHAIRIKEMMATLSPGHLYGGAPTPPELDEIAQNVQRIYRDGRRYQEIDRYRYEDHLIEYREQLAAVNAQIESQKAQLSHTSEEVARHQAVLVEMDDTASLDQLTQDILTLLEKVTELEKVVTKSPIPKTDVDAIGDKLDRLEHLCKAFLGCSIDLIPYLEIEQMRRDVVDGQQKILRIEDDIRRWEERIVYLSKALPVKAGDIPQGYEVCTTCPLYVSFQGTYNKNQEETTHLEGLIAQYREETRKIQEDVDGKSEHLRVLDYYIPYLTEIHRLINSHSWMKEALDGQDILKVLQRNPINIYQRMKARYDESHVYFYVYQDAKERLARRQEERGSRVDVNAGERQLIAAILETEQDKKRQLEASLDSLSETRSSLTDTIRLYTAYTTQRRDLLAIQKHLEVYQDHAKKQVEKDLLQILLDHLEDRRSKTLVQISHIENMLRSQELLKARYDEEVIAQIQRLQKEQQSLIPLEEALSPTSGIPHKYATTFLNDIIEMMNYYIEMVFSYPLRIFPIDPSKPLDYDKIGYIVGDDTPVGDISECSEGQAEIIDLTFSLAQMAVLSISDKPLFLDEPGRTFDPHHKQQLLHLLRYILVEGVCSQLYMINHHAVLHEGMNDAEVLVLKEDNVVRPQHYNQHVVMT